MRKFYIALLAALAVCAGVGSAHAGIQIGSDDQSSANRIITTVYNDSGATLQSGAVVVWDTGSGDPVDSAMGTWVTTTTSADSTLVAGVVSSNSIPDQQLGEIIVYGPAYALWAATTDGATDTAGTAIGTTTVAGQFGIGSNLGVTMETSANSDSGDLGTNTAGGDFKRLLIFVNPSNGD
jgi:hypothetical protein